MLLSTSKLMRRSRIRFLVGPIYEANFSKLVLIWIFWVVLRIYFIALVLMNADFLVWTRQCDDRRSLIQSMSTPRVDSSMYVPRRYFLALHHYIIPANDNQFTLRLLLSQHLILTCFMTCDDLLEVVEMVIIITRCAQNFKGQISNYRRSSMIKE